MIPKDSKDSKDFKEKDAVDVEASAGNGVDKKAADSRESCPDGFCGDCPSCDDFAGWEASLMKSRKVKVAQSHIVDRKTATLDFYSFCDAQRVDIKEESFNQEEKSDYESIKRRIVEQIMFGNIKLIDGDAFEFSPISAAENVGPFVFTKPKGRAIQVLDKVKKGEDMKGYTLYMAQVVKCNANDFNSLDEADAKTCRSVINLFLGS